MSDLRIGLTGGIGSGKSSVARLFADKGIDVIDLDVIAREVVAPGQAVLKQIQAYFGKEAICENGSLNRAYVREKTFNDENKKTWLNSTLHPLIRSRMLKQIDEATSAYCIVDVPLLTENNMAKLFDRVLVVDCPEELQITRAMARDNSDKQGIKRIIAAQATREQRRIIADDVIANDSSFDDLTKAVDKLHLFYESLL